MPEKKGKGVVPRLRFPEFRDAGPWEVKRLEDGIKLVSGQHLGPKQYTNSHSDYPYFTGPSDFTDDESSITKWVAKKVSPQLAQEGDVLVTVKGSGVGELWQLTLSTVAMGRQLMAIRGTNFHSRFLFYFLDRKKTHLAALAAGNMIPGLSRDDLLSMPLAVPSLPEQQKIADCLSSLDDLIRAEEGRLDALKDHKKGLMQQLFPAPGKTTPRLRFPEFRDAGPWGAQRFGDVVAAEKSDLSMSEVRPPGSSPFPVYGADGIVGSRDSFQQENTCISMVKDGSGVGRLMLVSGPASVLGTLIWLKPKDCDRVSMSFLFYAISSLDLMRYVVGSGIPHLYFSDISAAKFSFPRLPEQQKIADCLSSLDDLIRAKAECIDALKTHKRGLMQQLFPREAAR